MRVLAQATLKKATLEALHEIGECQAKDLIPRVEELSDRRGLMSQNIMHILRDLEYVGKIEIVKWDYPRIYKVK